MFRSLYFAETLQRVPEGEAATDILSNYWKQDKMSYFKDYKSGNFSTFTEYFRR